MQHCCLHWRSITEPNETMHWLERNNNALIVRPESLMLEWDNRDKLNHIFGILDEGIQTLVLDLSLVEFLSSVGLSFLLSLRKKSDEQKVRFELLHESPQVERLLNITRLERYFKSGSH